MEINNIDIKILLIISEARRIILALQEADYLRHKCVNSILRHEIKNGAEIIRSVLSAT